MKSRPFFFLFGILSFFSALLLWFRPWREGAAEQRQFSGEGLLYRAVWNQEGDLLYRDRQGLILIKGIHLSQEQKDLFGKGVRVVLNTSLYLPQSASNPGEMDYQQYLLGKNVLYYAVPQEKDIVLAEDQSFHPVLFAARIRSQIRSVLVQALGRETGMLVLAVMTGDTAGLEADTKEAIRDAGFSHLMAVSGTHVLFFLLPFRKLVGRRRLSLAVRNALLIFPLVFFAFLAGGTPSVLRAVIMTAFSLFAQAGRRRCDALNALGFSGCIQLAGRPYLLYQTGFLLSYGAVLSLLLLGKPCRKAFRNLANRLGRVRAEQIGESRWLAGLTSGLAVNLGLLPLLLYFFNRFSILGLFLNLLALPLASWLCIGGYALFVLSLLPFLRRLIPFASPLLTVPAEFLNGLTIPGKRLPAPLSAFTTASPSWQFFLWYYSLLLIFCYGRKRKRRAVCILTACCLLFTWVGRPGGLEILFFDVGQGSCALIRLPDGVAGLIDGGDGRTDVSQLLYRNGVSRLDFVLLTHGHADHAEGLFAVLEEHQVRNVFVPVHSWDTAGKKLAGLARQKGCAVTEVSQNLSVRVGKHGVLTLYCAPSSPDDGIHSSAQNNSSLFVQLDTAWGRVLFPGDMEREREEALWQLGLLQDCDVLAVAHHGSDTSTTLKFLEKTLPEYAIISVGRNNSYGHPSDAVLSRLRHAGAFLYRTDEDGAVRIRLAAKFFTGERTISIWQKRKN